MEYPRISVALCTYNGGKYLRDQLNSIAAQSILPAELVICDDGSTDQTVSIIQDFMTSVSFPVLLRINEVNLGVSLNYFQAISICSEDWVMLCDQDDVWMRNRIELFLDAIVKNRSTRLVISDGDLTDSTLAPMNQTLFHAYRLTEKEKDWIQKGRAHQVLARHVFATGAGMAVQKSFVMNVPKPLSGILHDEWIAWFACPNMVILPVSTFYYRQHDEQVTGIDGRITAQIKRFIQKSNKSIITLEQGIIRYQSLLSEMCHSTNNISEETLEILRGKVAFLQKRNNLPLKLPSRFVSILFQIRVLNYWKFAAGYRTLLKDLSGKNRL